MIKVGINGFGRIGSLAFRAAIKSDDIEVVAINAPGHPASQLAYSVKYDTVHGRFDGTVESCDEESVLVVDGKKVTKFETVEKEIKKDLPSRLHARRQMLKVLNPVVSVPKDAAGKKRNTKEVDLVAKLFDEYAPKYADRKGGYTRIVKIGQRKGDAAMEVVLELV